MIAADTRGAVREVEARLRPFIARRVSAAADVDDVVQEVLLRVHRGLSTLREEDRFGPWVYRIARTAIADHRRARRRHPLVREEVAPANEPCEEPASESDAEELLAQYVAPFVAALPSPYREALTLTELEGLSQVDAAKMLGVPLSTMKSRVQRGRARLRAMVETCCSIALDARGRVVGCEPRAEIVLVRTPGGGPTRQDGCAYVPTSPGDPRSAPSGRTN